MCIRDRFWNVWDNAENLYHQSNAKQEESSVITVEHTLKNQSFVSISDWLCNVDSAEEEKEAAGYSPFETESERDFSTFQADELSEVMRLINEVGRALATRFSRRTMQTKKRGLFDFVELCGLVCVVEEKYWIWHSTVAGVSVSNLCCYVM